MGSWISNPSTSMYGRWDSTDPFEGGVDLPSPAGTPVYALADGPLVGAGYFWHSSNLYTPNSGPPGNAVVSQRIQVPGYGSQDIYYQHIQLAPGINSCYANICSNQNIQKGQLLGYIMQDPGEVEIGFNPNWGGVWGVNHPGPWVTDPRPLIYALMQTGDPGNPAAIAWQGTTNPDGTTTVANATPVVASFGEKVGLFVVALVLVLFGLYILFQKEFNSTVSKTGKALKKAAETAVLA